MTLVVINKCFGGFSVSKEALELIYKRKGKQLYWEEDEKHPSFGPNAYTSPTFESDSFVSIYTPVETWDDTTDSRIENRDDPDLVAVVKELGQAANGHSAELKVVEIPDDVKWTIEEYDGREWVSEAHRSWA